MYKSLRLAALEQDGDQFGQSFKLAEGYSDERWREDGRRAAESDGFYIVLAFDDAEPVGMSGCVRVEDFGKIIAVWVEPAHRGNGIGRLLVAATMDVVRAEWYKLTVVEANQSAIHVYQSLGFAPTGFSYVNGKGLREFEMAKGFREAGTDRTPGEAS
jgi:GNAT superfamily N-acetyltransferase